MGRNRKPKYYIKIECATAGCGWKGKRSYVSYRIAPCPKCHRTGNIFANQKCPMFIKLKDSGWIRE